MYFNSYLSHHGIKGQRWGVRRFQNEDGSLTQAGKERYGVASSGEVQTNRTRKGIDREKLKKGAKIAAAVAGTGLAAYGAYRMAKNGDFSSFNERAQVNSERIKDAAKSFKLTNEELTERIGRMKLEKEYRDLVLESVSATPSPARKMVMDAGRKTLGTVLSGIGLYSVKALLTNKIDPKDAANYITPKPKTK